MRRASTVVPTVMGLVLVAAITIGLVEQLDSGGDATATSDTPTSTTAWAGLLPKTRPGDVLPGAANSAAAKSAPKPPGAEGPAEGEGIGSIEIPKLGLVRYVFEGVQLPTLDRGPGHWPGTAMPGEVGNAVIAGHRTSHNADFADLNSLRRGDEVIFNLGDARHVYTVRKTEIVAPQSLWIIDQTRNATATLFACHPRGSVSQRIVVHLRLKT
ncbi:MAG: class E sortase [Acidimicrobiia bacterium]|nr:class E sortase [Acidimicrobiia bacterium]